MTIVSLKEIERQYRVLRQTLSMHAMLRDEYACKAKLAEILLLACSVVFCATAFAADQLYLALRLSPEISRIVLGIASIIAFIVSLSLLILDWKGQSALHKQAVEQWSKVLQKFRQARSEEGIWPEEVRQNLNNSYWEADRMLVKIPEKRFNELKTRHLRKVAISQLKNDYTNCPRIILRVILGMRDTVHASRELLSIKRKL
jgi:hypothetical protein